MRYQLEVPILAHEQLADFEFEITLESPEVAAEARPGQFMQILYDQTLSPFTRRPFSVYRVDRERGIFTIVYLARGVFTQGLRKQRAGQMLSVVGPLGNWFEPDPTPGVTHIMAAGGVGSPPLYFLAKELVCGESGNDKVSVINGARNKSLLVGLEEFAQLAVDLHITTDDGSHGCKGVVTDTLSTLLTGTAGPFHVYACGPTPMLRAVGDLCLSKGVPCQLSVETVMPCGVGVCMGCVVKIRDAAALAGFSYQRSCYEGPVFSASEIIWE